MDNTQSAAEKFEARFNEFQAAEGVPFIGPDVKQAYQERVQMIKDAIQLKKPVRVPACPVIGTYPFNYTGVTVEEAMYDYGKLGFAMKKFHADFLPDTLAASFIHGPGKVLDLLDYKIYRWPGHGVPVTSSYQCVEGEYMLADEYDVFISDPTGFFIRTYLPRAFGAFETWKMFSPFTDLIQLPFIGSFMVPFGIPPAQESLRRLLEAGQRAFEWIQASLGIDRETISTLGLPGLFGGFALAPFDILGSTLRGWRGIMLDMFNQPDKLLTALDRVVPMSIDMGLRSVAKSNNPFVFIPLHKGADGFMSDRDFKTFYWPTVKATVLGLIKEGIVPSLLAEGGFNQRLSVIVDPDIPKGTTRWFFDRTDMKEVKKRFTGWACFGGNVPLSLLHVAKPEEITDYVKELIDNCAQDGGYILSTGAALDHARPENFRAMIETGKEYGKY